MKMVVSIDPGRDKCGLVLADIDECIVLEGKVASKDKVQELIIFWIKNYNIITIFLGNGTTSKLWEKWLRGQANLKVVEEKGTTLRARYRYFELWPLPRLLSWIPRGLLLPRDPLDAVAALVLLEDHLYKKLSWPEKPDFRIWT